MLEIINYNEDEYHFPCLLVLGCFDGVHIGHAELLKKAKLQAKINGLDLGVMMFAGGKGGKQVFTFEERVSFLEQLKVKFVLKVDFNDEFKKTKPLEFLQNLEEKLNVKAYMSGKDFRFGEGAKGKASTLKAYAEDEENGVWYMSVKDVVYDDQKVSTTLVKKLLSGGEVKKASELLGRNFSVSGKVIAGADRGGKIIGFPTINLEYPEDKTELKHGVYTVKCTVGENVYDGIANFGDRPTFDEKNELLEVHLEGFEGSCYDSIVTVEFIDYIRDIQKFDSPEALREQLLEDKKRIGGTPAVEPAPVAENSAPVVNETTSNAQPESVSEVAESELAVTEQEAQPAEEPTSEQEVQSVEEPVAEQEAQPVEEPAAEQETQPAEEPNSEQEETPVEEKTDENGEN